MEVLGAEPPSSTPSISDIIPFLILSDIIPFLSPNDNIPSSVHHIDEVKYRLSEQNSFRDLNPKPN